MYKLISNEQATGHGVKEKLHETTWGKNLDIKNQSFFFWWHPSFVYLCVLQSKSTIAN